MIHPSPFQPRPGQPSPRALSILYPILCCILPCILLGCGAPPPPTVAPDSPAGRLHAQSTVIDLHADPTLWNPKLLEAEDRQAALPQLKAGGVDGVIFGIPSQGLPIIGGWAIFSWMRGFPREARRSSWAAAMHQITTLQEAAASSKGALRLVNNAEDFRAANAAGAIAGLIGVEGGHALEGDLSRLKILKDAGVFYIGPVHLSDNDLGGSNYKLGPMGPGGGLTDLGRAFVREAVAQGLVLDLAHASQESFWDIMEETSGPVMMSHTGLMGVHESWRNLPDKELEAIAKRGGVIGVMFGNHYLGDDTLDAFLDHITYAVAKVGAEHVSLGTDFDGFVPLPKGIEGAQDLPKVTQGLLERGLTPGEVSMVLGGSFLAFLERVHPPGD